LSGAATTGEVNTPTKALHASRGEHDKLLAELAQREAQLTAKQVEWEASQAVAAWTILEPADLQSTMGATFAKQPDNSILVAGASARGSYTVALSTDLAEVTAIRLELLGDGSLPAGGPGRAPNGNLTVSEFRATAASKTDPAKSMPLSFARATDDFSQDGYPVANAIDGNPQTHWAIHPQVGKNHAGIFEIKEDVNFAGGVKLTVTLDQQFDDQHTIGRFRVAVTSAKRPVAAPAVPEKILEILAVAPDKRNDVQKAELTSFHRSRDAEWVRLNQAVAASGEQLKNERLTGAQDLAWALINSPAFLFNR
jgi:hypothetical protein